MRYLGGKNRIAKEVCRYLESVRGGRDFVEPFCGGLSITSHMIGRRIASDASKPLITLYKALQGGWIPPDTLSLDQYLEIKYHDNADDPLTGFAGYGCSWGGKYFCGYASDKTGRNYCLNAKRSLLKKINNCLEVTFFNCDYFDYNLNDKLIYCDPPYAGTTGYSCTGSFNHNEFWECVRKWSAHNVVLVSEYSAPSDFEIVWQKDVKTDLYRKDRVEKIYKFC